MAWFFCNTNIGGDRYTITGEDAEHISRSLRMKPGEELTLVSPDMTEYSCVISSVSPDGVSVNITGSSRCANEPSVRVTLYQSIPKSDKLEQIVQKAVELGVYSVVPVLSARCVSRPDARTMAKKQHRLQKIARNAAMQSCRGIIPEVCPAVSFGQAVLDSTKLEQRIIFYELGGESLVGILSKTPGTLGVFIGCEGGFEQGEVQLVASSGGSVATLGRRILRCETAPVAALSAIMLQTGNFG